MVGAAFMVTTSFAFVDAEEVEAEAKQSKNTGWFAAVRMECHWSDDGQTDIC
jgi:hypothetical protein